MDDPLRRDRLAATQGEGFQKQDRIAAACQFVQEPKTSCAASEDDCLNLNRFMLIHGSMFGGNMRCVKTPPQTVDVCYRPSDRTFEANDA